MNIALKQLEFSLNEKDSYIAAPNYIYTFNTDRTHINRFGYRIMGACLGACAYRVLYKNIKTRFSLRKKSVFKISENRYAIDLVFNVPSEPLVFDNKDLETGGTKKYYNQKNESEITISNQGFELFTHNWTQDVDSNPVNTNIWTKYWTAPKLVNWTKKDIITEVQIVRNNTIRIICSENPEGLELWYARRGSQGGGFVRDSQSFKFKVDNVEYPVYNWMPLMYIQL